MPYVSPGRPWLATTAITLILLVAKLNCAKAFVQKWSTSIRSDSQNLNQLQAKDKTESEFISVKLPENTLTEEYSITVAKQQQDSRRRRGSLRSLFGNQASSQEFKLNYTYKCDKLLLESTVKLKSSSHGTTGVVLIHPVGVGIARWFYERLLNSLHDNPNRPDRLLILSPDLLGSGSACDPSISGLEGYIKHLPLLNISDWSDQLIDLMAKNQVSSTGDPGGPIDRWCVIANGGCSPIALQAAARSLDESCPLSKPVSNVIISSSPRLPFFLNPADSSKVAKAYKRLCGIVGRIFWWYACRNEGKFIQTFSEKNLVADPANLGDTWRSNCYHTAISCRGLSRYSTFAFLAGCLQDGCKNSLDALKGKSEVQIDVIKGRDIRQNRAKSWFWQKTKRPPSNAEEANKPRKTFRDYVEENGNGGRELFIGGRISLAHEDPIGYSEAIISFLNCSMPKA